MNKIITWFKRLFCRKKPMPKKVLEKINIDNKFKKKHLPANKKTIKPKIGVKRK